MSKKDKNLIFCAEMMVQLKIEMDVKFVIRVIVSNSIIMPFPKLIFFKKPYSESPFPVDFKKLNFHAEMVEELSVEIDVKNLAFRKK